jgi:hypothetical protein
MLLLEGIESDDNMILANVQYPVCEKVGTAKGHEMMAAEFGLTGHHPPPPSLHTRKTVPTIPL